MDNRKFRVAIFHNLPSGGGIRVLNSFISLLGNEFNISVHYPSGSSALSAPASVSLKEWPFPQGKRITGSRRVAAPFVLISRLKAFDDLCKRISRAMNDADIALVHNSMYVAAPPVLKYLEVPTLYFCYEYPRHIYEPETIRRADGALGRLLLSRLRKLECGMDQEAVAAAESIVTLSAWMRDRMLEIYERKAGIIRPGIDTNFFRPGPETGRSGVLSVGALWPYKGHDIAIQSVSRIRQATRPSLTVIADREYPDYGRYLKRSANDLKVQLDIRMNVSDRTLLDLYSSSEAVLCCQKDEPYGLVPLEAMACGTPVIAVNQGGFRDNIRNGENGFLVHRNPESISTALNRMRADPELRRNIVREGLAFVTEERTTGSAVETLIGSLYELRQ